MQTYPMLTRRRLYFTLSLLLTVLMAQLLLSRDVQAAGPNSITTPDTIGNVGSYSSVVLDSTGNPVIAYYDEANGDLKVMHCNDVNCAGNDESITNPDNTGTVGREPSLVLDANGYPVISYNEANTYILKLMHCNDVNCAGGDESSVTLINRNGWQSSLLLDAAGYPVISLYNYTEHTLTIIHCSDANCTGTKSTTNPDTSGDVGASTSLQLDANGFPVVSYYDVTNGGLKILHCNDVNCAGGGESITKPDATPLDWQWGTSLELDSNGYPVISYLDGSNNDLKVMHCNDVNCAGNDESIVSVDTAGMTGYYSSLELDASGYPVISTLVIQGSYIRVIHCNDANCAGGDESITQPDTIANAIVVGTYTSLVLDNDGYPVVSYYEPGNDDLKVLHCTNANCTAASAPVANNDSFSTNESTPLTVAAPGVLGNDTDADGNALTALIVVNPTHGTVVLNTDGSFIYTPVTGYYGLDSFTYKANDGTGDSNVATVSLTVNAVNDAPVATNDSYTTAEDTPLTIAAPGVLGNDTDPENATLTVLIVSNPAHGTVTLNTDGSFSYTPAANYNGADSFTYMANDGGVNSNVATVSLTVNAVNDAPVATNDNYSTNEDMALMVAAPGVLGNDSDVDGNTLTALIMSNPAHGTVTLNMDGNFIYTPALNYNGADSFTYKANDGATDSNVVTVNLTVNAVNDAPVATNDSYTTDEDTPLTLAIPGVLINDSDVEGSALTVLIVSNPAHGAVTLNSDGSFSYTPAANYNGADSFTYMANDGGINSNVATVNIIVAAVNDAPVATNDSYTTAEDTPLTVAAPGVLGNDSDVEGSALTASVVIGPSRGTVTLNPNGSFTYTPALNYNGPDSFTYKVTDGALNSNIATVNLSVTPVEDIPSYAVDNTDNGYSQIVIIDLFTGVATPFGARQALDIEDVALHPTTGVLYASTGGNGTQKGWLYRVDRTTGVLTAIGQTDSKGVMALTFRASDATLWGWVEGTGLIQINLTTAKSTVITKNTAKFEGLAWAPNGKLYLARDKTLTEYNPTNQTFTTYATNLPKGTESLDILPNGRLVGGARDSKITLFSYNLTTKQITSTKTLTGATGFSLKSIEGLTWHASLTPPPGF